MVDDPRDRYDDLLVDGVERELDADEFEDHRRSESFRSGWVAGALTFDDEGRGLLAYHGEDEVWMAPGGTLKPNESLREGLERELREETGVAVSPDRPQAVTEWTVRHGDRSASFRFVLFEATAETTDLDDGADPDGEITDADWFDELPGDVLHREQTERVLARCDRWDG